MKKPSLLKRLKHWFSKFRFFFRWKLRFSDLNEDQQDLLARLCHDTCKASQDELVFTRTFNNVTFGEYFEFIGWYPVFHNKELCYCYFSEDNTID